MLSSMVDQTYPFLSVLNKETTKTSGPSYLGSYEMTPLTVALTKTNFIILAITF
ncbi:hypothetical protein [Mesorhizobium sp. M0029]|uniref:hypothetical protein n=1 Tax=Mesorhizobium sp. M0029 TaxID=2956850 RepID=UPI00333649EA